MKVYFGAIFTLLTLWLAGCEETLDRSAAAETAILEADREFAWLAERSNVAHAFRQYLAEDAVMLPDGSGPLRGDELENALESMDYNLEWAPEGAWGGPSGKFGVTWGYWTLRAIDADGNPSVRHGKYTSVWRKNDEGEWKVVMDMGNDGPAPEAR